MKHKRKGILRKRILVICVAAIVIGIVIGIVVSITESQPDQYSKNRQKLEKLEKADVSETEKAWTALEEAGKKTEIDDSKRNEYGVVVLDNVTLKKAFENTVIVGDSFSEGIISYGFLDESSVVYKRGASVKSIDELVTKVISMKPACVIMEFGCNDLTMFGTDIDGFITKYKEEITKVKKGLPDATIYVNSILPMTEEKMKEEPGRQKIDEYNEAIKKMCDEDGYLYIDSTFIVKKNSALFEADGIHMKKEYYTQWLSYLVEKAGL